ncbi:MAG: M20/M25/M40 family metallo-hydrolase, partial [Pseudomonadota bacterium]
MTRLTSHLDAIGSADARIAETLTAWSNVNSGSGNLPGIERMADLATAAFGALNYDVRKLVSNPVASIDPAGREVMSPRGPMLHFSTRPNASKRIMLAGHLDTVFPETSAFQSVAKRPDGTLHGPGVADMKGGLLIMLEALKCFEASPFAADVGIDVVLNSDEEIASHASHEYMEKIATGADAGF